MSGSIDNLYYISMNKLEQFKVFPKQVFAVGPKPLIWQQVLTLATNLADQLSSKQLDQVVLYCDDSVNFSVGLLACAMAGVNVYLVPDITTERVSALHEKCQLVLSDQDLKQSDLPKIVLDANSDTGSFPSEALMLTDSLTVNLHNIQITLETSGSSGQSKQLLKTWEQMCQEALVLSDLIGPILNGEQVVVCGSVSTQHMYGLTFRVFLSFYLGLAVNRERLLFPETLIDATAKVGPCIWVSSPTLLHTFNEYHQWDKVQSNVRLVISSGGSLSAQAKQFLQKTLATDVLEIYGSTETGVAASRLRSDFWRFFPSVQCQEDEKLGLGITSSWCPEQQYLADAISWHTDEFELLGRLDRIIKLADNRISLLQIEQKLIAHQWVADCYLAVHPSKNRVAAWIALNHHGVEAWCQQGRKSVIANIKDFLRQSQVKVALPRYWRFDTMLPRNSQGKLKQYDFEQALLVPIRNPYMSDEKQVSADEYQVRFRVPIDLEYFNGHFDTFHLVPGVVEVKWVLDFLKKIHWLIQSPRTVENLKFKAFLRPNDVLDIKFKRDPVRQKISFEGFKGKKSIVSGRIVVPPPLAQEIASDSPSAP